MFYDYSYFKGINEKNKECGKVCKKCRFIKPSSLLYAEDKNGYRFVIGNDLRLLIDFFDKGYFVSNISFLRYVLHNMQYYSLSYVDVKKLDNIIYNNFYENLIFMKVATLNLTKLLFKNRNLLYTNNVLYVFIDGKDLYIVSDYNISVTNNKISNAIHD